MRVRIIIENAENANHSQNRYASYFALWQQQLSQKIRIIKVF
jgi:hypothetical protein